MEYIETKNNSKLTRQDVAKKALPTLNTGEILWYLIVKHKFAISVAINIVLAVLYFVPFLPDLIISLVTR